MRVDEDANLPADPDQEPEPDEATEDDADESDNLDLVPDEKREVTDADE